MLWYEHILISFFFALLLLPYLNLDPYLFLSGVLIGSLLPDVDSYSFLSLLKKSRKNPFLYITLALLKYVFWIPYAFILSFLFGKDYFSHRSSSHSLIFLLLIFSAIYFLSFPFAYGILFGGVLHLLQDSTTLSGVAWFSPISEIRVRGVLRTGQRWFGYFLIFALLLSIFSLSLGLVEEDNRGHIILALFTAFLSPIFLRVLARY